MKDHEDSKIKKNFEDFLIILIKYKRIIILNVLIVTIAAVTVSLLISNRYTAVASFISPKKKGGLFGDIAGFSSTIKDLSRTLGGRLGAVSDEAYSYLAILQSRTASEKIIRKFDLREVYDIDKNDPFEDVIEELEEYAEFNIEDEGNVTISITDVSPKRAANMANYYIDILNEISTELGVSEARNNREFIEKRFIQLQNDISNLEDSLKQFSADYNVLELEEQMKAEITVAAELNAQTEFVKIELEMLKNIYGEDHPVVKQAELKLSEFDKRLEKLKQGENKDFDKSFDLFIPFKQVPEVGVKYIRLQREYEIQTRLMEFIYPIYEQAKIEEQKDIPVVVVLDHAIPPEKKSSPKRSLYVLASFILAFFFSAAYGMLKEHYSVIQSDENRYKKVRDGIIDPLKTTFRIRKR